MIKKYWFQTSYNAFFVTSIEFKSVQLSTEGENPYFVKTLLLTFNDNLS